MLLILDGTHEVKVRKCSRLVWITLSRKGSHQNDNSEPPS